MRKISHYFSILLALFLIISVEPTMVQARTVPIINQVATVNASSLRLRSGPSSSYATLASAPKGDYVLIAGKTGPWYQVSYNLITGYMHERYLDTYLAKNVELGYGTVIGNKVNLRSGPGTSYRVISEADVGDTAYVIGFNQQWYKVICKEQLCYIRSDYLELTQIPYENTGSVNKPLFFVDGKSTGISPSAEALNGLNSTTRDRIVRVAKQYHGVPYLWGGTSPRGFDCSGYVQYVLMQCGITIPRTTELQAQHGVSIAKSDLRPGDLVFLQNTYRSGISHVGIYIGDSQIIHASSSKGVTISNLSNSYYVEHYHSARRIVS